MAQDASNESEAPTPIRLAADALVVLAGPSGSGKSTWARKWFRDGQIVSSDHLRGVLGEHDADMRASKDAFAVLDDIVARRLKRGLLTVVDTLGMNESRNRKWQAVAEAHGRPIHLVRFHVEPAICRRRNKARSRTVPAKVLTEQFKMWAEVSDGLGEGFDQVHGPGPARVVPTSLLPSGDDRQRSMQFGLLVSAFDWPEESGSTAARLGEIAAEAEHAGFESIWVMDHFIQIPQVGREWDPMLEAYSTLAYLAARTSRVGLGTLVSCITHRNIGLLGKTIATLDVLSEGRARCGLGLGWFKREHQAFGYHFAENDERYELLEDALQYLPLQWGAGAPSFDGARFSSPEAISYPRPLQEQIPILVGGSGEKRTLRLAAQYADACNLFGEPDVVAHKVAVLHEHCTAIDRDPSEVSVTQLSNVLAAADDADLQSRASVLNHGLTREQFAHRTNAATVDEHIDRFGRLSDAGVDTVMVSLADVGLPGSVSTFGTVIDEFRA